MKLTMISAACLMVVLMSGRVTGSDPVLLELYYESMCPACQQFISGQLFDTWKALQKTG